MTAAIAWPPATLNISPLTTGTSASPAAIPVLICVPAPLPKQRVRTCDLSIDQVICGSCRKRPGVSSIGSGGFPGGVMKK